MGESSREKVKKLLTEAITILCRNSLHYNWRFSVEGLLGITVDDDEVFLVSIKESFSQATLTAEQLLSNVEAIPQQNLESPPRKRRRRRNTTSIRAVTVPNAVILDSEGEDITNLESGEVSSKKRSITDDEMDDEDMDLQHDVMKHETNVDNVSDLDSFLEEQAGVVDGSNDRILGTRSTEASNSLHRDEPKFCSNVDQTQNSHDVVEFLGVQRLSHSLDLPDIKPNLSTTEILLNPSLPNLPSTSQTNAHRQINSNNSRPKSAQSQSHAIMQHQLLSSTDISYHSAWPAYSSRYLAGNGNEGFIPLKFDNLAEDLRCKLDSGLFISRHERGQLLGHVFLEVGGLTNYPRRSQFIQMCRTLTEKWPSLLSSEGLSTENPLEDLQRKMDKKFRNMRYYSSHL